MDLQAPIFKQGYGMIPKIPMRDTRLSPEAKVIYAYLCAFAGADGVARPSADLMCKELGMSDNRFFKHRKQLEALGYISMQRPRLAKGFGQVVYVINGNPVHLQNVGVQNVGIQNEDAQIVHLQNVGVQNVGIQNEDLQNDGTINNSIINNSNINNSLINNSLENTPPLPPKGEKAGKSKKSSKDRVFCLNAQGKAIPDPDCRPEEFEQWYAAYPRHDERKPGIVAWEKAVRGKRLPQLSALLETLEWQIPTYKWYPTEERKKYIPLPASYLNGEKWDHEKPVSRSSPTYTQGQAPVYDPNRTMTGEEMLAYYTEIERQLNEEMAQKNAQKGQAASVAIGE